MTTKRGFTLIELLVVAAIILVLAALAFAFTNKGIRAAQSSKCVNNLRQVAATQIVCATDYNGNLVSSGWTPFPINRVRTVGQRGNGWPVHFGATQMPELGAGKINERIELVEMLNCPVAYSIHKKELEQTKGHARWRTYGLNTRIGWAPGQSKGTGNGAAIDGAWRLDQIEDASITILAAETSWNPSGGTAGVYRSAFGPGSARDQGMADHHNGGFHVAYYDGHVVRHTAETFPSLGNKMPDGRTVRIRTGNARNATDEYFSTVWRGRTSRRTIPDPQ